MYKNSLENKKQLSCLCAVMWRFLFVIYFIVVSLIIGLLLLVTPIYFIVTGKNWIELIVKKSNHYEDVLFKN